MKAPLLTGTMIAALAAASLAHAKTELPNPDAAVAPGVVHQQTKEKPNDWVK